MGNALEKWQVMTHLITQHEAAGTADAAYGLLLAQGALPHGTPGQALFVERWRVAGEFAAMAAAAAPAWPRAISLAAAAGVRSLDPNANWGQGTAQTELNYVFARSSATGPNADIAAKYFTNDNELMSPSRVRLQFGEAAWADYSAMLSAFTSRIPNQRAAIDEFNGMSRTIRDGAPPR